MRREHAGNTTGECEQLTTNTGTGRGHKWDRGGGTTGTEESGWEGGPGTKNGTNRGLERESQYPRGGPTKPPRPTPGDDAGTPPGRTRSTEGQAKGDNPECNGTGAGTEDRLGSGERGPGQNTATNEKANQTRARGEHEIKPRSQNTKSKTL